MGSQSKARGAVLPDPGTTGIEVSTASILAILVLIAGAFVAWTFLSTSQFRAQGQPLSVVAIEAASRGSSPEEIGALLLSEQLHEPPQAARNAAKPVWIRIDIPEDARLTSSVVEVQSRRFDSARLWRVTETTSGALEFIEVTRSSAESWIASKAGYSAEVPSDGRTIAIIGELHQHQAGIPKAYLWAPDEYAASELVFERYGGAVFGSLLILAAFSAIVAFLNRDITFLLFSGWLITSLRVAAVNAGWDKYWIGLDVNTDVYLGILRVSIAAYGFFTVALFRSLLTRKEDNRLTLGYFKALQYCYLAFVVTAPFVGHLLFLETYWAFSAIGLGTATLYLVYTLAVRRTRVTVWYALSWGAMIAGMASEIATQSGAMGLPGWLNSQSASVVSALIMGLALADRLTAEREGRLAAQANSVRYLKKYEANYNSMPVGLFGLDLNGIIRLHNPTFARMFALPPQEGAQKLHIDSLLGASALEKLTAAAEHEDRELELKYQPLDGPERWFLIKVSGKDQTIEGSIQDVTTRKEAEEKLKHLVDHDSLTGLLNRRGLEASLVDAIAAVQAGRTCAVAYIDLDRFKIVNDLHGHGTGDALLQVAAQRVQSAIRSADLAARLGDSFVVVFTDCPDYAITGLTDRIRRAIDEQPFELGGKGLNMTVSIGVIGLDQNMTFVDAIAAADRACAEAKARGRNCVVRLSEQDGALRSHLEELRVVADLQKHVYTDRYFLEFQPIVALGSAMASLSYEVLIRMRGENGSVIPPGKFIGAAERNGLMAQIDRWVLRNTLEWLDDHPAHRERLSFATINISGASLNDTRFVDDAFAMIAEHPLAMPKLCFEITESVALHDLGSTRRFVDRVRMYGSKLALDDFGAGYTSFNYLKEIPADFIKIDGSFVRDINRNPANYAITRTIVELTHELGMRSIAEWAETPDTIASLIELGVDYGQGFGLVRPTAPDVVTAALSCGSLIRDPQVLALLDDRGRYASAARSPIVVQRKVG